MDEHFRRIELNITIDEFRRLPRNPAYKFEYFGGRAVLTPRPKSFSCVRDLSPVTAEPWFPVEIRPLPASEAAELVNLFTGSVLPTQPFASLDAEAARAAARACLGKTLTGGDGPLIERACFQAIDTHRDNEPVGGILVTLVPRAVLTDPFAGNWTEPPPPDAVERKFGVPHLTWVFVHPWEGRRGIGTALLAAAVAELRETGFDALASTFMLDNAPSALWHWRNGFRLLPQFSAVWRKRKSGPA